MVIQACADLSAAGATLPGKIRVGVHARLRYGYYGGYRVYYDSFRALKE